MAEDIQSEKRALPASAEVLGVLRDSSFWLKTLNAEFAENGRGELGVAVRILSLIK
jgi:hypothetical protein